MTVRERAEDAVSGRLIASTQIYRKFIVEAIEQAITAAIEAEREACAMIADVEAEDTGNYQWQHAAEQIAENIRARSEGEKKGE